MSHPNIVSRAEWLAARVGLLAKEKALVRQRDALSEDRRKLPMVGVDKVCVFDGPEGPTTLRALFGRHRQLIIYHFMFDPNWEQGCPSCSHCADNFAGAIPHLAARDTAARSHDVAAAEDALADAFQAALVTWRRTGVPEKPEGWLLVSARRRLIDAERHARVHAEAVPSLRAAAVEAQEMVESELELPDERLKLLFVCAHPAIDPNVHTRSCSRPCWGLMQRASRLPSWSSLRRWVSG
jgi:Bacterial protein of unknown function (DUF899)